MYIIRFQSTLSLRRATAFQLLPFHALVISIHALLAESDRLDLILSPFSIDFNPRSPCGERPIGARGYPLHRHFNPRSPCGERPFFYCHILTGTLFQSTLSLRRATCWTFYGSTCFRISIHALLAESDRCRGQSALYRYDFNPRSPCGERQQIPPNWPYRFCLKCQFKDGEKSKKAKGSASAQASSPAYEKNKVRIPWGDFECFRFAPIK